MLFREKYPLKVFSFRIIFVPLVRISSWASVMLPLGISNNIVGKNKAFAIIRVQPKA